MTERRPRLEWLPPLLVGASAAVVAEVSLSLLLYGGVGFVRSLTTVLAVEGLAFAGGLWSAPAPGPDSVDRLRKRWLLCLFAFVAATLFGMAWSVLPELGEGRLGQGMGLALLAGVPLYGAGAVLGGMSVVAASDPGERLGMPGASAAAGAAAGFVLTGFLLPRVPIPASLLLGCLVMLSLGGIVYGGVLAARTDLRERARREGRGADVRVEERRTPIDGVAVLELREGSWLRRAVPLEGQAHEGWDALVARAFLAGEEEGFRLLAVGGGASSVARTVLRGHPSATADVFERTPAVVELGRNHFETELSVGSHGRTSVVVGNLDDAIIACDGAYDLVIVDSDALAPIGGVPGLSTMARRRLPALLRPGGALACGPVEDALVVPPEGSGWRSRRYRRPVRHRLDAEMEVVVVVRRDDGEAWSPAVAGFKEVPNPTDAVVP